MLTTRVAGEDFELDAAGVELSVADVDPEPIREHYVVIGRRRYPPKQVLAAATGLDRSDFTTHQASRFCGGSGSACTAGATCHRLGTVT